ncbi:MAG: thiamine pyrophosphate-binding protein [Burkholderiaceae bacterium]
MVATRCRPSGTAHECPNPFPSSRRANPCQADALAHWLARHGIRRLYSLSGNQIMPIYDACLDAGLEIVHVRHEGAAVFMADAAAQIHDRPAIALVTAGPGFGNALGAMYAARCSQSPVILLSGDADDGPGGIGAFQSLDQCSAAAPFVKASWRLDETRSVQQLLALAWNTACRAPAGPVHVALPANALLRAADSALWPAMSAEPAPASDDTSRVADLLAARLAGAMRPVAFAGPALARGLRHDGLGVRLSSSFGLPLRAAISPRGLRDPAAGAFADLLGQSDLIVLLGQPPDFSVGRLRGTQAELICVHPDPAVLAQSRTMLGSRPATYLQADPRGVVSAMVDGDAARIPDPATPASAARTQWSAHLAMALAHRGLKDDEPAFVAGLRTVAEWLSRLDDPILVVDGGEFGQWAQAFVGAPTRLINGPSGGIGGGLPMAIAAGIECPDRQVVLFSGDGSIGFHLAEFETAARHDVRPIVIVGNDGAWNAERQIQIRDYGEDRQIACSLSALAAYDAVARSLGGFGRRVESVGDLLPALEEARASGRVACLDWRIAGRAAPAYTPLAG